MVEADLLEANCKRERGGKLFSLTEIEALTRDKISSFK